MVKFLKNCLISLFLFLGIMPLSAMQPKLQPSGSYPSVYPTGQSVNATGTRQQQSTKPGVTKSTSYIDLDDQEEMLEEQLMQKETEVKVIREQLSAVKAINGSGSISNDLYNYYKIGRLLTVAMGSTYVMYNNTPASVKEALGGKYLLGCLVASSALSVLDFFHPKVMTVLYAGIGIGRYSHYFDAQALNKFVQKAAPEVVQKTAEAAIKTATAAVTKAV